MSFHDVLFPETISYSSSGGPKFKTTIFSADSGYEQRNVDWSQVRCEYDVSYGIKQSDQISEVINFFYARQGRAYGFRYKDWGDFKFVNEPICVGDGTTLTYQITKTYTSAQAESGESYSYVRPIKKPNWNTFAGITVNGSVALESDTPTTNLQYKIDYETGLITFGAAPTGNVVVGYGEFHVPVRFNTDHLDLVQEYWNTTSWPNIPLVEVRDL